MDAYSQWTAQNSGIDLPIHKIIFADENTGWAFSDGGYMFSSAGHIIKTSNGGINWNTVFIGSYSYKDVYFVNLNTAFMVSSTWNDQGQSAAQILKTTNGGLNVSVLRNDINTGKYFSSVFFADAGWICGDSGLILKSTNNGDNWLNQPPVVHSRLNKIYFYNTSTGWMIGNGGAILKTTNGGINWVLQYVTVHNLCYVQFLNPDTGYVTGANGTIIKTTDSGNNWILQQSNVTQNLNSVHFVDVNTGWIASEDNGGTARILKTTNGGNNWHQIIAGNYYSQYSIYFINSNTGWSAGGHGFPVSRGTIIKTTNGGGVIGITKLSSTIPDAFSLMQNYPNPFNPATKIKFSVKLRTDINITVFNSLGAEIERILQCELAPGEYEFVWDAQNLGGGVYFIEMKTSTGFKEVRRAVLLK